MYLFTNRIQRCPQSDIFDGGRILIPCTLVDDLHTISQTGGRAILYSCVVRPRKEPILRKVPAQVSLAPNS